MKPIQLTIICLLILGVFACKKETSETNDPTIDDRVVNISVDSSGNSNSKLIDLDNDGIAKYEQKQR